MPSPDNPNRSKPAIGWLGIVETLLLQVLVLLALSAAVIRYVNWSSDAAQAEFTAAGKPALGKAARAGAIYDANCEAGIGDKAAPTPRTLLRCAFLRVRSRQWALPHCRRRPS